ncbi:MAG: TonB-dependent receptor [Bacteroidota bacterium]|nr:TonB-dependent receptor [Bacteroidota bacterium]
MSHLLIRSRFLFVLGLLTVVFFKPVYPQEQRTVVVNGNILETDTKNPLEFASASLLTVKDTTLVKGAITNSKGAFIFNNVIPGTYKLRLSFVGYNTVRKTITIPGAPGAQNIGNFLLDQKKSLMNEVVITATLPVLVKKDTLEYNADMFKVEKNAVVEDMLKKLPGVEIDGTGNITAQGTNVSKVYVDGKQFFGNDPLLASQNLPAEMIAKVQVIDKKSDQAEFSGIDDGQVDKIINIITRQGYKHGSFGKATGGYGSDDRYDEGLMFNNFQGDRQLSIIGMANNTNNLRFTLDASNVLNNRAGSTLSTARFNRMGGGGGGRGPGGAAGAMGGGGGGFSSMTAAGRGLSQSGISITDAAGINFHDKIGQKIEITGSYFYNANNKTLDQLTLTQTIKPDSSVFKHDTSTNITNSYNHRMNMEFNYTIDSMNSILFRPNISYVQSNSERADNSLTVGQSGYKLNESNSTTSSNGSNWNSSASLLYRHKFNKPRRTFSLNLDGNLTSNNNDSYNNSKITKYITSTGIPSILNTNVLFNNTTSGNGFDVRASYTEPISKYNVLELNYYYSDSKNNSKRAAFDFDESNKLYDKSDTTYSNQFNNTFIDQRFGISLQHNRDKLIYTLGMGFEASSIKSETHVLDTLFNRTQKTINFSPTASLNYSFTTRSRLRLNYRGTTNQPTIDQLQPIVSDPNSLTIRKGNPDLKTSFTNDVSLSYNDVDTKSFANYFVNIQYSEVLNSISNSYINGPNGEQIIIPVNINGAYDAGLNLGVGLPIAKNKFSINTSGSLRWSNDVSYQRNSSTALNTYTVVDNTLGSQLNTTRTLTAGYNLSGNINGKVVMFTAAGRINYNKAWQSIQTTNPNEYISYNFLGDLKLNLPSGLLITTDYQYNINTGYGTGYNKDYALWNASIAKDFLKSKRAQVKFQVFDILKQNQSIRRSINGSNITDTQSTILPQYFMFSITYNFNNFLKPGESMPEGMRPRFGGYGGRRGGYEGGNGGGTPGGNPGGNPGGGPGNGPDGF